MQLSHSHPTELWELKILNSGYSHQIKSHLHSSLFLLHGTFRQVLRAGETPSLCILISGSRDETQFFHVTLCYLSLPSPWRKPLHVFGLLVTSYFMYYTEAELIRKSSDIRCNLSTFGYRIMESGIS